VEPLSTYKWSKSSIPNKKKAVTDRRLRPRSCHLESYLKRPKSSPVRSLACNWYYCAQFTAKSKAECVLRFSWAATSSNFGLWANVTSSIKPEVRIVSLRRQKRTDARPYVTCTKIWLDRTCSSEDMIADRQTHTHKQTRSSQYSAPLLGPA